MSFRDVNITDPARGRKKKKLKKRKEGEHRIKVERVDVLGRTSFSERQGSIGGNDPCSQRAKSSKNKNQLWTTAPPPGWQCCVQNSCNHWTDRALEGLLGWVVVKCCWHVWPLLQLVILQMKFLHTQFEHDWKELQDAGLRLLELKIS